MPPLTYVHERGKKEEPTSRSCRRQSEKFSETVALFFIIEQLNILIRRDMTPKKIENYSAFLGVVDRCSTLYLVYKSSPGSPKMVFTRILEEYHDEANYPRKNSNKWMNFTRSGNSQYYYCEGYWSTKEVKEHVEYIISKGGYVICSKNEMKISGINIY